MFTLIIGLLCLSILYILVKYIKSRTIQDTSGIPGPTGYPLVGNSFQLSLTDFLSNAKKLSDYARTYGPIFRIRLFGHHIVYLNTEEIIREALTDPQFTDIFNDRPPTVFSELVKYDGLVTQKDGSGSHMKAMKRHLVHGLHFYGEGIHRFEEIVKQELSRFDDLLERFGEKEFCFDDVITEYLCNIMSILLTGEPVPDARMTGSISEYTRNTDALLDPFVSNLLMAFPVLQYLPGKIRNSFTGYRTAVQNIMDHYFYRMKETFVPGRTRGLVDYYFNEQHDNPGSDGLSDSCIQFAILDVFGAGILTSKAAISGMVLCLMNHPDVQKKIQVEIDAVGKTPGLTEKRACPHAEATILEVLRYHSVVPLLPPRACKEDAVLRGYSIPKNTILMGNLWHVSHNKDIWGDPWTFRPERFLDENGEVMNRADVVRKRLLLFGLGRRRCPGEGLALSRIFLYLTSIMKRWTILPPTDGTPSCDPRCGDFEVFILATPKPFKCIFKKRGDSGEYK